MSLKKATSEEPSRVVIRQAAALASTGVLGTGVGVLLFDEMGRRLAAKGYQRANLSLTGEEGTDTWPLAHRMGVKIYNFYRFYAKGV